MGTIVRKGVTNAASATLVSPSGAIGDILIWFAFRSTAATIPTAPTTGPVCPAALTGSGSTCAWRVGFEYAQTTGTVSRTFTGATQMLCWRGSGVLGLGVGNIAAIASSATMNYGAITAAQNAGNSQFLAYGAHRTASNVNVAPTGMSTITGGSVGTGPMACLFDTNGGATGYAGGTVGVNATSGRVSITLELIADSTIFSPLDHGPNVTLSNSNLTATSNANGDNMARVGLSRFDTGLYWFQFVCVHNTLNPTGAAGECGFVNSNAANTSYLDSTLNGYSWNFTGVVSNNGVQIGTADTYGNGDVLDIVIQPNAGSNVVNIWCRNQSNGNRWNASGAIVPNALGTGAIQAPLGNGGPFFPACSVSTTGTPNEAYTYTGAPTVGGPISGVVTWDPPATTFTWQQLIDPALLQPIPMHYEMVPQQ